MELQTADPSYNVLEGGMCYSKNKESRIRKMGEGRMQY